MHYIHYVLILSAGAVNRKDQKGLLLSLIIGFSLVVPVKLFTHRSNFFIVCALSDLTIGLIAMRLNTRMSNTILVLTAMMCAFHATGMWFGGADPDSPYRWLMKGIECAEILACSVFPLLPERRKHERMVEDLLKSGRGLRKE